MTSKKNKSGKTVSLLGFGAMRIPVKAGGKEYDQEKFNGYIKRLLDGGVTYFDTAPVYNQGNSERILGTALAASGYPRDSYLIATKKSTRHRQPQPLDEAKKMFADSLAFLRTDYIDNYLLHSVGGGEGLKTFRERYLDNGVLDYLMERREAGAIRQLGFSFHGSRRVFDWLLEQQDKYRWDFVQIKLSYLDWVKGEEKSLYEALTAKKIPVVVMAPLKGGLLAQPNWALAHELKRLDREASFAKWAFRFFGDLDNVATVLSGIETLEQIDENIKTFSPLKPLSPEERDALFRAVAAMDRQNLIHCDACDYCMPCPYGVAIPDILGFRNRILAADRMPTVRETLRRYAEAVPDPLRRAERCTGCGKCMAKCPQALDIPALLSGIDEWIEELKNEDC